MTRIDFERSSGIVGRPLHYSADLSDLSEDVAQNLQRMIDEANFFDLPENLSASSTPDEFQYKLTVQDEDRTHTVHATDTTMPPALVPLVKELTMLKMLG